MKKYLFAAVCAALLFGACVNKEKQKMETTVERTIQSDLAFMGETYGGYSWYETDVVMNEYLDEDCTGTVYGVINLFQVSVEDTDVFYTKIVIVSHSPDFMSVREVEGYCLGSELSTSDVPITFRQAWKLASKSGLPMPHSKICILSNPTESGDSGIQYLFGDGLPQICVSADDGRVTLIGSKE